MKLFERILPSALRSNQLVLAALIILIAALGSSCAPAGRAINAEDLLDGWTTVQNYDATEIYFSREKDGTNEFNSFLRGRPYESGTWQIKGGDIVVLANGNNTYTFQGAKVKKNILTFSENGKTALFHRIVKRPAAPLDLKSLLARLAKKIPLVFSPPAPSSFNWQLDAQTKVKVSGLEIRAAADPSADVSAENLIAEVLRQNGFTSDPFNVTEIISGYRSGNVVVQIVTQDDPDDTTVRYITLRLGEYRPSGTPGDR